jgi:putative oligomerization/nucleic acid binding protein/phospholipase D-like protein
MSQASDFGSGQVVLSMLWFFLFFIWIWLLISIFADIFRSDDLSGWGKALWTLCVVVLPLIGVLVYLIVRGRKMHEHEYGIRTARQQDEEFRGYERSAAGSNGSRAEEISRLADLRDRGVLSADEFEQAKSKALL